MAKKTKAGKILHAASLVRFLGDESRFTLLNALSEERSGFYVHEVADMLGLSHSAASHQLSALEVRGIIERVREGQHVRYKMGKSAEAKMALKILRATQ